MPSQDELRKQLTAALAGPMGQLATLLSGGVSQEPCAKKFVSPDGACGDSGKHACCLTVPHIGHACECGAQEHRSF